MRVRNARSIVVFTVPERCDLYRAAFGDEVDFHLNPLESFPFDLMLENVCAGGGTVAVVDELHFFGIQQFADGVRSYLDKPANRSRELRLILVCSDRQPGDAWLGYFTGYLGLYDIVYGKRGAGAVAELTRLLETPNKRVDVLALLAGSRAGRLASAQPASTEPPKSETLALEAEGFTVNIQITVTPKKQAPES